MERRSGNLTELLSVPVNPEFKKEIVAIADHDERTLADMARQLLKDGLRSRKEKPKRTAGAK